ncbi:MAG: cytochrome c biogenesis heme-transporting ATPase CcmA [Zoogloeaceae bacterium]|jgi:heme exporter protein A|nr:cytochrome c biogenesis heme-transporting ATPase CcmA [Zoogloeaceae bacterium]
MLNILNLAGLRGDQRLFQGVGFTLVAGELLFLEGKNGAGKTTLLRMLCGLTPPDAGEIRWQGEEIRRLGGDFHAQLCYLGHQNAVKEDLTPLENLLASAHLAGEPLGEDAALAVLEQVGMAGREDLACRYLSQGQKRRAALARLARERRPLWILDEPFVALDTQAMAWLSGVIGAHLQRGGLVVMTTHQAVEISAAPARRLRLGA